MWEIVLFYIHAYIICIIILIYIVLIKLLSTHTHNNLIYLLCQPRLTKHANRTTKTTELIYISIYRYIEIYNRVVYNREYIEIKCVGVSWILDFGEVSFFLITITCN